jgi:hypothetical protein
VLFPVEVLISEHQYHMLAKRILDFAKGFIVEIAKIDIGDFGANMRR